MAQEESVRRQLNSEAGGCIARIKGMHGSLFPAAKKVADYILAHASEAVLLSITELSERCGVSEATVVRFCQNIGYEGFHDLKIHLAGELVSPTEQIHEDVSQNDDTETIKRKVVSSAQEALRYTQEVLSTEQLDEAIRAIAGCRKVEFYAMGNARPIAHDALYRFRRIGIEAIMAPGESQQLIYASQLTSYDVAIGISYSGSSKYTVEAVRLAKEAGATTIAITGHSKSPISKVADVTLCSASRETAFSDEAMASRIAQFCIVDILYVGVALRRFNDSYANLRKTADLLVDSKF